MQQNVASATDSEPFTGIYFQMIEECEDVFGGVPVSKWFCEYTRLSVITQVWDDELKLSPQFAEARRPVLTRT